MSAAAPPAAAATPRVGALPKAARKNMKRKQKRQRKAAEATATCTAAAASPTSTPSTSTSTSTPSTSTPSTTPTATSSSTGKPRFLVVLDFEATCEDGVRIEPQEIIEFPSVLLDLRTRTVVAEFHTYVRPTVHPRLTRFCTGLTGITQTQVDGGVPLLTALAAHGRWLAQHGLDPSAPNGDFFFVTCGDWDLKTCLPKELQSMGQPVVLPPAYREWINIKKAFKAVYGSFPKGMTGMLSRLGLPLVGRHHSGIDDSRNICAIAARMLADGWQPRATTKPRAR